jgi:hypothetical protein
MTTRTRIRIALKGFACIVLALGSLWHGLAVAQSYPSRSIAFVAPYPPGGAADVIARAVGQRLSVLWNRSIIIDNKGGASTQIGASYVAKSQPDGYTLRQGRAAGLCSRGELVSKGAEQGSARAQVDPGYMYERGQGVPWDYVAAHMWFSLAAAEGLTQTLTSRDEVAAKMTPEQIAEAEKRFTEVEERAVWRRVIPK